MNVLDLFTVLNISIIIDFQSSNPADTRWCADLVDHATQGPAGLVTSAKAFGKTPDQALENMVKDLKGNVVMTTEHVPGTLGYCEYKLPLALHL